MTEINADAVDREIRTLANRVINDAINHRDHPSYITKPMGRENVHRMMGAFEVGFRLGVVTDDTEAKRAEALAAAATWLKL